MLGQRGGECFPTFHVLFDLLDRLGKQFAWSLLGENVERLHDWQAGVDHSGELTGEDHYIFRFNFLAKPRDFDLSI